LNHDNALPQVLVVHPAMTPYHCEFFNALHETLRLRVLFVQQLSSYDSSPNPRALEAGFRGDYAVLARNRVPSIAALARRLWCEASRFRPDVLITPAFSAASAIGAVLARTRRQRLPHVVWTTKNDREVTSASGARRPGMRWLTRALAAVLAYRMSAADLLSVWRDNFFVCANHQDPDRLRQSAHDVVPARLAECQARGLAGRSLVLGVSRLARGKNVGTVVEAFGRAFADDRAGFRAAVLHATALDKACRFHEISSCS
jgi:hypothetical protein